VFAFIAGAIMSSLVENTIVNQGNLNELVLYTGFVAMLLLVLISLTIQIQELRNTIKRQKLSVDVGYASTKDQDRQLYAHINEALTQAQKSIRVVGMYRPAELPYKEGRKGYYDILAELIELKIQQNQPFIYERIVQVANITSGKLHSKKTDPTTLIHCTQILQWKRQKSAVFVHVKQIPRILGGLSFVIIDNERYFMVIPDIIRNDQGSLVLEGLQLSLNITDPEGVLTEPMKTFFAKLFNEADTIISIEE